MTRTILLMSILCGCGGEESGEPPAIDNLSFSPTTVTAGAQTTISGTMGFSEPDGDLAQIGVEVTLPDGSQQSLPLADLQGVGDRRSGDLAWAILVNLPSTGSYGLELWVTDAEGHESNRLTGTLAAQ